jgi:hypothetical protein
MLLSPPLVLKRKAERNDPAMVVLVELRHGDLNPNANSEVKSLREWNEPRTSPGVRKTCVFPSKAPPDQNVEFCSSMGQIFPLIR